MNTPTIVKQKASYEKVCEFKTEGFLTFPREDSNGNLHVISSSGEIFQFNDSTSDQIYSLNGQANGLCFDSNGYVYITDLNSKTIMFKIPSQTEGNPLIDMVLAKEYDGHTFKGPTCLTYNKEENLLYFADSGNFETASFAPFDSIIYSIDLDTRVMRPILTNLSYISDICYDSVRGCIYIAETFMNRIVRLKQNNDGVFHASPFFQFSGRIGPSAMALDENGNLFVARYEFSTNDENVEIEIDGLISVLNSKGLLIGEMNFPKLPEISGLYISPKKRENLYVTTKNSTGVFKIKISVFTAEMDKYEEAIKLK